MTDALINVKMPEAPEPNIQPEDPLKDNEHPLEEPTDTDDDEPVEVDMKIKEIVPDNEVFNDASGQAPPKRKKREISEKQKAHLAKIRVKALEAKKAKKAIKEPVKSAKKVYEQKVEEDHYEYSASEDDEPGNNDPGGSFHNPRGVVKVPANSSLITLSQEQLKQLQFEAIYGYDTIRKARKEEKKKAQAQKEHEQKTFQAVSRAINRPVDDDGWGVCFH
jgi:hypothetical protein